MMLRFGHGMTRAPMPHRGDVMPWGGGAGPMQAAVTDEQSGAALARPRAGREAQTKWAGKASRNFT